MRFRANLRQSSIKINRVTAIFQMDPFTFRK